MDSALVFPSVVVLVVVAGGCLESSPFVDQEASAAPRPGLAVDVFPVGLDHDHTNAALHDAALGLHAVAHLSTAFRQAPAAPIYNLGLARGTLVASLGSFAPNGNALVPPMGLLVADVKDVANPRIQSVTHFPGSGVESIAITDDARFAFLGTEFAGAVGIWTVDLANPASPQVLTFTPQPTEGPHNLRYGMIGQRHFVFASVSHVATGASAAGLGQDPLPVIDLRVDIFEFDPGLPRGPLSLVSSYQARDEEGIPSGLTIVHDAVFQQHPVTGQPLLYVAHWDRGVRIVDLTSPEQPKEIGKFVDLAPTDFLTIHTVKPHPTLIDGRHVTVATAQCAYTPASPCFVRILDTTDPTRPTQVGTWTLPEDVHGGSYTTEIFDLSDGRLFVPWGHGGVWALDISTSERLADPAILGYYFVDAPATAGAGVVPFSNAVWIKDGHAIVADVRTGLHVLDVKSPP